MSLDQVRARAHDDRTVAVLLAIALAALQSALVAARLVLPGVASLVLTHRLGRRFPDVRLGLLVAALSVIHLVLFLALPRDPLWLALLSWPLGISMDTALVATGQHSGRLRRGDRIPPEEDRRANVLIGLVWTITAVVFSSLLLAALSSA